MPEIKERPILFSGPMVRAILDGRKTVTRRALKVQPVLKGKFWELGGAGWSAGCQSIRPVAGHSLARRCPFGQPGDRLWVRESWEDVHPLQVADGRYSQPGRAGIPGPPGVAYRTIYRADGPYPQVYHTQEYPYRALQPDPSRRHSSPAENGFTGWTPSIHMPRWASRILLEVIDVRIERLQDITDKQAQAEGVVFTDFGMQERPGKLSLDGGKTYHPIKPRQAPGWHAGDATHPDQCLDCARFAFANLWEKTGGDWGANPWVWAVEFKRIKP